jgi:hypothetical protein
MIQLSKNTIQFSQKLLGSEEAFVWVGFGFDPKDNNDARVQETRELMQRYCPYVPYGMGVGNGQKNWQAPMQAQDGMYSLDVSWWPVGVYRLNLHSKKGEETPFGSKLHPENRDQDCSWAKLESYQDELKGFLHKEENGAGHSIRFLIRPDRTIEALGDSFEE